MKMLKSITRLMCMLALFNLAITPGLNAQTFTNLYYFTMEGSATNSMGYPTGNPTNSDGADSEAGLVLSGNTLYGTTDRGGYLGFGTVFVINTDGTGFTNLYNFTNGYNHISGLVLSSNTLYGTTTAIGGGSATVFAIKTDGTGFTNLLTNDNEISGLVLSSNTLYGTTTSGGTDGYGFIFAVNTDGTGFTNLYNFTTTNNNGSQPISGLVLSSNTLYGTTIQGGDFSGGTIFRINTDGTDYTDLCSFVITSQSAPLPFGDLTLSGNKLYGITAWGGSLGYSSIYAANTDGTGFTNLYSYNYPANPPQQPGNFGLALSGNTLYGTTAIDDGRCTVFAVNTDGTGYTILYNFTEPLFYTTNHESYLTNSDGDAPFGGVILSSNKLYGTALDGGYFGSGTVYSLSLPPPQLAISLFGTNVILMWPTNRTGFILQSATNLVSPVWSVVNGQNAVTNPISGTQQFFRLSKASLALEERTAH